MRIISILILRLLGWQIIKPQIYPDKCVIILAPHTSNWDFFYGKLYAYILGIDAKYLAKRELFIPLISDLIKWNGGIPVDRKSSNNLVDNIVDMYRKSNHFILALSPEGTRSKVKKWKTGFYYIAQRAKVPILLFKIDYRLKEIGVFNVLNVTNDYFNDMNFIENQYKNVTARHPKFYNSQII